MILSDANKIFQIWGKYLEYTHGKVAMIFMLDIPESFLPFPKVILSEAFQIMSNHYQETNNLKGLNLIRETSILLSMYKDDEESLLEASKNFSNPEWCEHLIPAFKEFQIDWMGTQ